MSEAFTPRTTGLYFNNSRAPFDKLGGSVVVEVIFSIPGMGRLLYESVVNNDVPALQPGIMSLVGLAVLITTLTDQLYACINRPISAPGR